MPARIALVDQGKIALAPSLDRLELVNYDSVQELIRDCKPQEIDGLIVSHTESNAYLIDSIQGWLHNTNDEQYSVFLITPDNDLQTQIRGFSCGFCDIIDASLDLDQIIDRIYHDLDMKVINVQLKSQLATATQTAMVAMSDNADLGANNQFFIDITSSQNIDQLGMYLFRILDYYQIKCSIQLRSRYETKNMERNGMAKPLESQLLTELQDAGRYFDFGQRSVMNYESVSVLVKNMPKDANKYGAIKDNVFCLLQGAHATICNLDNQQDIRRDRNMLRDLTQSIKGFLVKSDEQYQNITSEIATVVEDLAMQIHEQVLSLDLTEDQERGLTSVSDSAVSRANDVFNNGIKVDSEMNKLVESIDKIVSEDLEDFSTASSINPSSIGASNEAVPEEGAVDEGGGMEITLF